MLRYFDQTVSTPLISSDRLINQFFNQSLLQPVTPARTLTDSSPPQSKVKMASIMEGPLSKWTNVMKGWQYRWFVLDYNAGLLSYYTVGSSSRLVPVLSTEALNCSSGRWLSTKGLLFVRSWESQLAQRRVSLKTDSYVDQ